MIRFEGTLTPEMYRRALGVIGRRMRFFAGLWIVVGVIGLFSAHLDRPVSWGWPLFLVLFGLMLLLSPRMTVKRAFATDLFLSEPITGEADEQGIRMEQPHGRTDLPWTMIHKIVMTPNLVTIYQSASLLRILPREFFADEESWQAFRRFAAAAPSSAKPSPRLMPMFLVWIAIIVVVFLLWMLYQRT
jgi:MFS family permease